VAGAADFSVAALERHEGGAITARIEVLKKFGKPIVANEDDKAGACSFK
jgi:hypothetical protein